jgi:hypothetical protein
MKKKRKTKTKKEHAKHLHPCLGQCQALIGQPVEVVPFGSDWSISRRPDEEPPR